VVALDLALASGAQAETEAFQTIAEILNEEATTRVIVMTTPENRVPAVKAIARGAYDYIAKPLQMEELKLALRRTFNLWEIEQQTRDYNPGSEWEASLGIDGSSPKMQEIYSIIRKVARSTAAVLIVGEEGTGKEILARAIHQQSDRKERPFVTLHCDALDDLLERELFGVEMGPFSEAHAGRPSQIEVANGGTLFLDEVGELSIALQVKLLRVLQDRTMERIGGKEQIPVNVTVIAATNTDLLQAMKNGSFRRDLYYRLALVTISLPPLRERGNDLFRLAHAILRKTAAAENKPILGFTPRALQAMEMYSWLGNVRELENRIKRAVIMADGPRLTPADMELTSYVRKYEQNSIDEARVLEKQIIEVVLARHHGNLRRAAIELSLSRSTLLERMEILGISRHSHADN
jgi:two-component system NtrC family response regulator